jgi:DNA-binding MarR family transcriptional regulator
MERMRMPRREAAAKIAGRGRSGRPELGELFDETVALYLRLTAIAATMYRQGELSGPRRTLLMALARSGPQTVAHLARVRAQSRQRLQPLVNALIDEGLLAVRPNPLHKQSPLVVLTPRGQKLVREIAAHEGALREKLRLAKSRRRIIDAVEVLRDVRQALERQAGDLLRE